MRNLHNDEVCSQKYQIIMNWSFGTFKVIYSDLLLRAGFYAHPRYALPMPFAFKYDKDYNKKSNMNLTELSYSP